MPETPEDTVHHRLAELQPIHARTIDHDFTLRLGQTLEIAIFRTLETLHNRRPEVQFFGSFRDLDEHDDSTRYSKIEPEAISGRPSAGGKVVDFVLVGPSGLRAAIEAKNVRQWLYPDRTEIKNLLLKSCRLDAVCQGRSKIRPPWRRKTRPLGRWVEWRNAAVRRGRQDAGVAAGWRAFLLCSRR